MTDQEDKISNDKMALIGSIVSAYVSKNVLPAMDVPGLIRSVHDAFEALGKTITVESARVPAVPIRKSILPDAIICLECGVKQKMLKRHLKASHDLEPADYRLRWSLPNDYPLISSEYSARRSQLATDMGLGSQGRGRPKAGGRKRG
jgi:predicted transcriptional regulator